MRSISQDVHVWGKAGFWIGWDTWKCLVLTEALHWIVCYLRVVSRSEGWVVRVNKQSCGLCLRSSLWSSLIQGHVLVINWSGWCQFIWQTQHYYSPWVYSLLSLKIHDNGSQIFSEHIRRTICNRTMRFGLPPIIQWLTWSKEFQIGYHSIISLHKQTSQLNMSFKNLLPCYKHSNVEFEDV